MPEWVLALLGILMAVYGAVLIWGIAGMYLTVGLVLVYIAGLDSLGATFKPRK